MGRGSPPKWGWQESLSEKWSIKSRPEKWGVRSEKKVVASGQWLGVPGPRKSWTGTRNGKEVGQWRSIEEFGKASKPDHGGDGISLSWHLESTEGL